ncbi:hypothetical protein [uncultured Paracoccus sp.]|uniref:hypothetical protein n=1 Tax=uncultured Paracoccus sp. TaxID=189685 RepID=UPI00261F3E76|nr:hypothetical protein [uncultured Paracoccus sp.]
MEFEAISAARMIALMLAGGLFALAGLYMMLRPKSQGSAKIELFGLKFESSSAGLLVFIVGAAFLAVTIFVPERHTASNPIPDEPEMEISEQPVLPIAPTVRAEISEASALKEAEPNDELRDAQSLLVGQVVAGKFKDQSGDKDWFSVFFDSNNIAEHEVKLRHVNGNMVRATLYDSREHEIGEISTRSGAAYFSLEDQTSNKVFIKVSGSVSGWDTDAYEISVALRQ